MFRIRAFSLMEVIVAMSLSSVLVYLCFEAYFSVNDAFRKSVNQINRKEAVTLFQQQIISDFQKSSFILFENAKFKMQNPKEEIVYQFQEDFCVRTSFNRDTFQVDFRPDEVIYLKNTRLVESVQFISGNERNEQFELKKNYSVEELMNHEN